MDRAGVATSITSITTPGVWIAITRRGAPQCNDFAARLVVDYPGRFGMFAALPPLTLASLREIEHGSTCSRRTASPVHELSRPWLGDPAFEPGWLSSIAARPWSIRGAGSLPRTYPGINEAVIEYGTDTARAIARLLFSGTAGAIPTSAGSLHGGGVLPMLLPSAAPAMPFRSRRCRTA
jgi:hypothetical protein